MKTVAEKTTKHALIADGVDKAGHRAKIVHEVFPRNPNFHAGLLIIPVPDNCEIGWLCNAVDNSVKPDDSADPK
jgi:hypothetical protein